MALSNAFKTKAFRLKSSCGREYLVPVSRVAKDCVDYLVEKESLTRKKAQAAVTDLDIHDWFSNFTWEDVEKYGTLVKEASPADIRRALNAVRSELDPLNATMARMVTAP